MIKNREEIKRKALEQFGKKIDEYFDANEKLNDNEELTLDNIEEIWTVLNQETNKIVEEVTNEIIANVNEKEIIRKKKLY